MQHGIDKHVNLPQAVVVPVTLRPNPSRHRQRPCRHIALSVAQTSPSTHGSPYGTCGPATKKSESSYPPGAVKSRFDIHTILFTLANVFLWINLLCGGAI